MTGWLLDTNVLSELRRPRPEPKVVAFVSTQPLASLYVSSVSLAEIRFGIERLDDAAKRAALRDWLDAGIRPMFESRVLPVTEYVMLRWRMLVEEGRRVRHTFPQPDLIIAVTALQLELTIVTRDTDDYQKTGVALANPWAGDTATG
ncbi:MULTISPECIES: type II toxin-antitoxin system VapC family toxin [unclassified Methylobacterium]|uniref:type II toxin-antitoxin system VapC family toxin n=1 Tax=unclassified Methylobacterium TaxID=2615210 RepID=UPI0036F6B497